MGTVVSFPPASPTTHARKPYPHDTTRTVMATAVEEWLKDTKPAEEPAGEGGGVPVAPVV